MYDDDEIKAAANRLRQRGWADKPAPSMLSPAHKKKRHIAPAKGFGPLAGGIQEAARIIAKDFNGLTWPAYLEAAHRFGLSYDDAVRAVGEAKRLAGEQ